MANPCSNTVTFEGDENQIRKIMEAYEKTLAIRKEIKGATIHFVLFDDSVVTDNYMSNFYLDLGFEMMQFETKWGPDPTQLVRVAKMFGVSFVLEYEETAMSIYGEFRYDHIKDELSDRCCTNAECEEAEMREDTYDHLDKILETKEWHRCTYDFSDGTYKIHDLLEPKEVA